jgi:ribosomal-protein-alanine N-acetyltransferase
LAIGVLPKHQRKGIGTALLEYMEEIARKYGVEEMLLWTAVDNQQALSFFRNAGFHIVGSEDRYYPRGQAALVLSKKLSQ